MFTPVIVLLETDAGSQQDLQHALEASGFQVCVVRTAQEVRDQAERWTAGGVLTLRENERRLIVAALRVAAGHRAQTARLLGISERNLYRKIRTHEIPDP